MPLVVWSEKLSVGVQSVDQQHTTLFDLINNLHDAMMMGQGRKVIGDLLADLLDYTRTHFREEEQMLERVQYPDLAKHQTLHRNLTQKVEEFQARYAKGDLTLSNQVASFLSDWLKTHILEVDQAYGRWLKEKGLKVA